jgi:hypothetical protein
MGPPSGGGEVDAEKEPSMNIARTQAAVKGRFAPAIAPKRGALSAIVIPAKAGIHELGR